MPNIEEQVADQQIAEIAARLREYRSRRGWTLDELARRSGLSKSYLSRLEDADRQPSIAALLSLARAFSVSLSDLVSADSVGVDCTIVRGAEAPVMQGNGLAYQVLTPRVPAAMQPLRLSVPAERSGDELYNHAGEEWIYVLSGTLLLALGSQSHTLRAGDSVYFNAETPHRLTALEGRDVEAIVVASASPKTLLESYM